VQDCVILEAASCVFYLNTPQFLKEGEDMPNPEEKSGRTSQNDPRPKRLLADRYDDGAFGVQSSTPPEELKDSSAGLRVTGAKSHGGCSSSFR